MVSSNPQTWTVPPLKISVFYMGGNHHLDHVQTIYHMYSWWKKLRQISGEICAKKQREMAKNNNSGKIYGGSHLHSLTCRRTWPWQRSWLPFKQALKSLSNSLRVFSSYCTILQHHSGHSKMKISLGNPTVSGGRFFTHQKFIKFHTTSFNTSTPPDLKVETGQEPWHPREANNFSDDVEMGIWGGGVGTCPFLKLKMKMVRNPWFFGFPF